MIIQIDSREKTHVLTKITAEFDRQGIKYYISKLIVGDYMSLDNPRVIVDRKRNLGELVQNLGSGKSRFYREIKLAKELGIKLIILCEHGGSIHKIEDVANWENPHTKQRRGAMTGRELMEKIYRCHIAYGVEFLFCDKRVTGKRIIELLGGV